MGRAAILLLLTWCACAAEPDASASWNPRDVISVLADLRAPLDAAPDDQRLLGQVLLAYVELCFNGDPDLVGQLGPWLGYAEQIAARRRQLRGGAAPVSFADASPELWLTLVEGDTVAVVTGLEAWPAAAAEPQARALRAAATRDVRPFLAAPPTTALEWYGYLTACVGSRVEPQLLEYLPAGVDPVAIVVGRNELAPSHEEMIAVRTVFEDVAWMLMASHVPDAVARPQLIELTIALGGVAPQPGTDRGGLVRAAMDAAGAYDCQRASPFIVAWKACLLQRGAAGGIRIADGRYQLIGVGDFASWNLSRLYIAGCLQPLIADLGDRYHEVVGGPLNVALPGTLLAAQSQVGWQENLPASARQLAAAMRREFAGQGELPIALACAHAAPVAGILGEDAADLIRLAILTAQPADGSGRQRALRSLALASETCGTLGEILPAASRQLARDPYNQEAWRVVRRGGGSPLIPLVPQPTPADLARAARLPWLCSAQSDVGLGFAAAGQWTEALPYLTAATTQRQVDPVVRRIQLCALAKQSAEELAKPGRAAALVAAFRDIPCLDNDFALAGAITIGLERAHAEDLGGQAFAADFTDCCVACWPLSRMALARGDWPQARRQGALMIEHDGRRQRWLLDLLLSEQAILGRIDGIEPDWGELRASSMDSKATPYIRLFTRWFIGLDSWDEVVAKIPATADGDAVFWLRGLYDVSIGDIAGAQQVLRPMVARNPHWIESDAAAGLLRWCAKQTPASIAALKRARPLEQVERPVPARTNF